MTADLSQFAGRPVIIGSGLAGLMTALQLAPEPVLLITQAQLGWASSSALAQGGLAASIGEDDRPELHLADTIVAGNGLTQAPVAERILNAAPQVIETLSCYGATFDRTSGGQFELALEAAHSRHRIVHAGGDFTGREIVRALTAQARQTPSIAVLEGFQVLRLLVKDGAIAGVLAVSSGRPVIIQSGRVVIATGGAGGLFLEATTPETCFGLGLSLAARAGAELADLEFIQFHPTALDSPARPMPLISEAVRGEGAVLIDETGTRFLADERGAELAPRDTVARGIWRHIRRGHRVFLDARRCLGERFTRRFPAIAARCLEAGIDPAKQPIPVRPAVHYHMGGIAVDEEGRSSVAGLWACGEAASTGLHGANRLASNSLIEAAVCACWVAESVAGGRAGPQRTAAAPLPPPRPDPAAVRPILSRQLGIERDAEGLRSAIAAFLPPALGSSPSADPAIAGLMIAISALRREESRGAHFRRDFPHTSCEAQHSRITLSEALAAAPSLAGIPLPHRRSA
jgi:L-aspartate oxidase